MRNKDEVSKDRFARAWQIFTDIRGASARESAMTSDLATLLEELTGEKPSVCVAILKARRTEADFKTKLRSELQERNVNRGNLDCFTEEVAGEGALPEAEPAEEASGAGDVESEASQPIEEARAPEDDEPEEVTRIDLESLPLAEGADVLFTDAKTELAGVEWTGLLVRSQSAEGPSRQFLLMVHEITDDPIAFEIDGEDVVISLLPK